MSYFDDNEAYLTGLPKLTGDARSLDRWTRKVQGLADEEECALTELPVNMCACRKHRGGQTPQEEAEPSRCFPARWSGECSACGEPFRKGDLIRFSERGRTGDYLGPCCG